MLAIAWRQDAAKPRAPDPYKPLIVGPENTVTMNDMWASHAQQNKRMRI
jgi:hypothetical protein